VAPENIRKKEAEVMSSKDAAMLAGEVHCARTVEEMLAGLQEYTPPRFRQDEVSGKQIVEKDITEHTQKTPAQQRARRMQIWLALKSALILVTVITEIVTFVAWQIASPDDFLCESNSDGQQAPDSKNLVVLLCVIGVHMYRTVSSWIKIMASSGLLPRWVCFPYLSESQGTPNSETWTLKPYSRAQIVSVGGLRKITLLELIPLIGFTT
jgi:hypothetical protein